MSGVRARECRASGMHVASMCHAVPSPMCWHSMLCGVILSMLCKGDIVMCGSESDMRVVVGCIDDV